MWGEALLIRCGRTSEIVTPPYRPTLLSAAVVSGLGALWARK